MFDPGPCVYMEKIAVGPECKGHIDLKASITDNLKAVAAAAGGSLNDVVRVGVYLTDLGDFATVNAVMGDYFSAPYPARSTIQVSALPKAAVVEIDAVMVLG
jgi:reactive intermediate/imine deaminase